MRKFAALFLLCAVSALHAADKPNILFIAIDDLNDWIGVLGGHPQAKTPNLDRLAKRGVLFTHAYAAAPACNPSRAALMTGIAPYRSGVYTNSQDWRPSMGDKVTLSKHFMLNGYDVSGSGKIYHGAFPHAASWGEYWPSQEKNRPDDPKPDGTPVNGIPKTGHFDWGPVNDPPDAMGDWQVVDWVSDRLQQKHRNPFFLACGIFRPHLPWYAPQKYFDQFPLDKIELPSHNPKDLEDIPAAGIKMANPAGDHANIVKYNQWRQAVQGYLASIAFADEQVGRVLDTLDLSPYKDNTIVVLWGDHGWHLGEKEHWRKFALWEEATKTPLMWVIPKGMPGLPEGVKAGTRIDTPVSLLDIYPTLVELAGLPEKEGLSGSSLVPLLKNPNAKWTRPVLMTHGRKNHAIRTPDWRYIRYADGSEELYDHRSDPMEWANLAADQKYASLIAELSKHLPSSDAPDQPVTR